MRAQVAGSGAADTAPGANVTVPLRLYPHTSPLQVGEKNESMDELPKPPLYKAPPPDG